MYKGGSGYSEQSARVIKFAGLLTPLILIIYGFAIQMGYIHSPQFMGDWVLVLFSVIWLPLALLQFFTHSKTAFDSAMRLVGYHLLSGAYLLFVSGVATPLVACWILLMISSYVYFSQRGLWVSIILFIVIAAADVSFWHVEVPDIIMRNTAALMAVLFSGLVLLSIHKTQEVNRAELSKSKAQERLQRDRILTIVNNLTDAIVSTDAKGVIRVYNAAALNLIDTNQSLNGRHIDEILQLETAHKKRVTFSDILDKSHRVTIRDDLYMSFEDERIRLEVTYSPIRKGYKGHQRSHSSDGFIVIMRDITKAKSLEEERDEFISVVSHELRTPITIVEGALSNLELLADKPDTSPDILKKSIAGAHDQILFLAKMVNDLSTLSRAERGVSDEAEDISVEEVIRTLHDTYAPQAEAKKLLLNIDIVPQLGNVHASRLYLEELLQNLVTNAIKYTKQGDITITARKKQRSIVFSVKDTGIGISKSDQGHIFDKFYRSEDYRTRETGGTGLGLYVAAKLARKLGTNIELTSRLNHGSTFTFTLPAKE